MFLRQADLRRPTLTAEWTTTMAVPPPASPVSSPSEETTTVEGEVRKETRARVRMTKFRDGCGGGGAPHVALSLTDTHRYTLIDKDARICF